MPLEGLFEGSCCGWASSSHRIHIKTADQDLPVESMTEEMAQVLQDTTRPEDQQKIMKTLSEKKVPPSKVAELAKKCH